MFSRFLVAAAVVLVTSCTKPAQEQQSDTPTAADIFLGKLAEHCGQAYEGHVLASSPASSNDPFVGKTLVMHVRECTDREVKIPFHVGDDHSRTWIITRTEAGLRLKHDHRHEDGSDDAITMYGGDSRGEGTETRQEFPVDSSSIAMFERERINSAVTNVWAMEIEPGKRFLYELARPEDNRLFQVEFDLTKQVEVPPAAWGSSE